MELSKYLDVDYRQSDTTLKYKSCRFFRNRRIALLFSIVSGCYTCFIFFEYIKYMDLIMEIRLSNRWSCLNIPFFECAMPHLLFMAVAAIAAGFYFLKPSLVFDKLTKHALMLSITAYVLYKFGYCAMQHIAPFLYF